MPEGDTIFRVARTLHTALAGRTVTRFETVLGPLRRVDEDHPIAGRTIEHVKPAGKHLLVTFTGDLVLRTHLRMNGAWHIYRVGERWQLPRSAMRIVIETAEWAAVAFRVQEAEFIRAADVVRRGPVASLGPDVLGETFDADEALRRVRARSGEPIGDVLLNQRVIAGIGNIYKSESLLAARVHPETIVADLSSDEILAIIRAARALLRRAGGVRPGHRPMSRSDPSPERAWAVYGRRGERCRICGTAIAMKETGADARVTYWCPTCQPQSGDRGRTR